MVRGTSKREVPAVSEDDLDPILEECLNDALGPFVDDLSPEELADHRRFLTMFIKTHPAASARYDRLRGGALVVMASGDPADSAEDGIETPRLKADGTVGGRGK
jgi:hypothetical protein